MTPSLPVHVQKKSVVHNILSDNESVGTRKLGKKVLLMFSVTMNLIFYIINYFGPWTKVCLLIFFQAEIFSPSIFSGGCHKEIILNYWLLTSDRNEMVRHFFMISNLDLDSDTRKLGKKFFQVFKSKLLNHCRKLDQIYANTV